MAEQPAPPSLPTWTPDLAGGSALYRGAIGQLYPSMGDLSAFRAALASAPLPPLQEGVKLTEVKIPRAPVAGLEEKNEGSVEAEWQVKEGTPADAPVVLYFHGGAYTIGSIAGHRISTAEMAVHGLRVLSVEYRMAPEAPFPAGVVDGVLAYKWLLAQGTPASKIIMSGDSAGGGLTYAIAQYLRDKQTELPMPAGLAPLTPWIDMTISGPCNNLGDEFEMCMLQPAGKKGGWLIDSVNSYCGKTSHHDPMVSFILDEGKPMPPTYISTGTADRLYSEDIALAINRSAAGEKITFDLYEEMFHDFQLMITAPIAQVFYKRYKAFCDAVTSGNAPATKFSFVKADGSATEFSVAEAKQKLAGLIERAEKAGVLGEADPKVKLMYAKAVKA